MRIHFKYWVEAVEDLEHQIRDSAIQWVKDKQPSLKDDEQGILGYDLKGLKPDELDDLIHNCDHANIGEAAIEEMIEKINTAPAGYNVQEFIKEMSTNKANDLGGEEKTYKPKSPKMPAPSPDVKSAPPAPAAPPPPGPQAAGGGAGPMMPPQI